MQGKTISGGDHQMKAVFTNEELHRYSEVLLWGLKKARTKRFRKGDLVLIRFNVAAIELAEIIHARLLDMGMNPVLRMSPTAKMEFDFYGMATGKQLVFQAPGDQDLMENLNGNIYLHAPESLTHLRSVDPKKIGKALVARKPLREILVKREEQGLYGWTLCTFPTLELAKQARLTLERYTEQIVKACFLDHSDPVAEWTRVFKEANAIKKWLNGMDIASLHIESAHADLVVTPGKQRKWIGVSGHNIPSFEVFISPDWKGTCGRYFADQPSYRNGNYVKGLQLLFERGSVVSVAADEGETFVKQQIAMDRGAQRLGEFSLTDKRFSKIDTFMADTLFDENHGGRHGNCHIALGASYSDTFDGPAAELTKEKKRRLGFNDSALHWDLVNTEEKRVTAHLASGKTITIYEDGMFTY